MEDDLSPQRIHRAPSGQPDHSLWLTPQKATLHSILVQFTSLKILPLLLTPHQVTCPDRVKHVYTKAQSCLLWLLFRVSQWMWTVVYTFQGTPQHLYTTPRTEEPLTNGRRWMAGRSRGRWQQEAGLRLSGLDSSGMFYSWHAKSEGLPCVCAGGSDRTDPGAASIGQLHIQLRFRIFQFLPIF